MGNCSASEDSSGKSAKGRTQNLQQAAHRLVKVPLPPSYTSSFKPTYEPTSKAGQLQQMCSLELTALVSSEHRGKESTAMIYGSLAVEHMVQTGAPAGFWERCDHVDHYTLGEPGSDKIQQLAQHLVFVSMAQSEMVCKIADLIVQHWKENRGKNLEYTVACIPGATALVEQVFTERLLAGTADNKAADSIGRRDCVVPISAQLQSLQMLFLPLEEDVFSMEVGSTEGLDMAANSQLRSSMAQGLSKLDALFNGFGRVQAKGDFSVAVLSSLEQQRANKSSGAPPEDESTRDRCRLLAIDRTVDLISVLCTQLTYGGLVQEVFGSLRAASEYVSSLEEEVDLPFTVGDPVWAAIQVSLRNVCVEACSSWVLQDLSLDDARERLTQWQSELLAIQKDLESMRQRNASISEMKAFVAEKLPKNQEEAPLVSGHLALLDVIWSRMFEESLSGVRLLDCKNTEHGLFGMNWYIKSPDKFKDYTNALIRRGSNQRRACVELSDRACCDTKARVLRLLCLATLTSGGLREKDFQEFKSALAQNYGPSSTTLIQRLERAGLLSGSLSWQLRHGLTDTDWEKVRAQFDLVAEPSQEEKHSRGYMQLMPLVARLIPLALNDQWESNKLSRLPGNLMDRTRQPPEQIFPKVGEGAMFVLFSGGCTRAEISEVRAVAKELNREMIVLTTGIINGDDFIYGFMD